MLDFIPDDGYTITARLHAVTGQHNQCDYTYRPCAQNESAQVYERVQAAPAQQAAQMKREFLAKHIIRWSLKTPEGEVAPVTDEWIRRLPSALFNKLWLCVLGFGAADCELDAEGNPLDPTNLADEEKNSPAGSGS